MDAVHAIPIGIVLAAGFVAAVTDIWRFRVYNVLTIPLFLTGILYHVMMAGWEGLALSMGGALFGLLILIVPYLAGLMGAGDVKLLTGVGAWLGFTYTLHVFVISSFVTGFYALILILCRGKLAETWVNLVIIFHRLRMVGVYIYKEDLVEEFSLKSDRRTRVIPFGASVPIGIIGAGIWLGWFG